jgi:hypothetical protein
MMDITIPKHTLISYSRNKCGDPIGVIVAVPVGDNGYYSIGYSQCRKTDKFSKKMGLDIALGRVMTKNYVIEDMPTSIRKIFPNFIKRCQKYYRGN